ncbi:MAG: hypothetical protein LC775_19905, partial [Acidobacteria bacterium]|nr:hypothetical protein [Acidobacteriota bacterium]
MTNSNPKPVTSFADFLAATESKEQQAAAKSALSESPPKVPSDWSPSRPKTVDQTTVLVDQSTSEKTLDDQTTSRPVDQSTSEQQYPSRRNKLKIGIRLPAHKVERYRLWCFINKVD